MSENDRPDGGVVRLFPLSDVVLFPYGMLPLHIFEPRYRQMTADALERDRGIAMVLPEQTMVTEEDIEPVPIHTVACFGVIVQEKRLQDGRYHLILRGESRVRILRERPSNKPYRLADVEVLEDVWSRSSATQSLRLIQQAEIVSGLSQLMPALPATRDFFEFLENQCTPPMFADIVSYAAPIPTATKQQLLEIIDVDERYDVLTSALRELVGGKSKAAPWRFPPAFSRN